MDPKMLIDGRWVSFTPGQTILEAALAAGYKIPTLCYYKKSGHCDVCRICVVEVIGSDRLVPSCSTQAREGMEVWTNNERITLSRRRTIDMLLASGRHWCLSCDSNGDCRLQDLAYAHGAEPQESLRPAEDFPPTYDDPFITRDFSKCILCGRCAAACDDVQVHGAIPDQFGRRESRPGPNGWFPLPDQAKCAECGECVDACPVGALTEKAARGAGRSWETQKVDTTCPYCGVGCTLRLNIKDGRVLKVTSAAGKGVNDGSFCVKGRFGYEFVSSPDRLKKPLIRTNPKDVADPGFREAEWDEALELIVKKFRAVRENSPDSFGAFSSARCTNEENYIFQKFARAVMGTNNVDHCARLCHASTVAGLALSFGSGAMTNSIKDLAEDADVYFVIGSNTTEAHPVIGMEIKQAVRHRDAKVIVADPRKIGLVEHAALWVRQRPGTDVALLNGIMNAILFEMHAEDKKFIEERTEGFAEFSEKIKEFTPEKASDITGIPADDIRYAAGIIVGAKAMSIIYSMGITQHTTGVDNVLSVANLAMLTGNIGRPGTGVNPLRGQNNVQGACDMGALPGDLPGYQKVGDDAARKKFEDAWGAGLESKAGFTVTEMMDEIYAGRINTLYIMGENPVLSDPDSNHVKKALAKLDFMVVQDIFLTETGRFADIVLPAVSWAEKDGTFTNTERRVQMVRAALTPVGESKADWQIIKLIAEALGEGDKFKYSSTDEIFDELASLTPQYAGMSYGRLEGACGIQWPCPTKDHPGTPILHAEKFTRGLGKFHAVQYRPPAEMPDREYPFVLTTGRILQHYHTGTMTRRVEGLNHLVPEAFVEINPKDAARLDVSTGDFLKVASRRGEIKIKARVTVRVAQGEVFIPFHFVEASANVLTAANLDPVAKIPEFKVSAVNVSKA
jgi:formate dehydrogenase (NADP+) alpha subunit